MSREASILLTLRDQYSPRLQQLRSANADLGREFETLRQRAQAYETRLSGLIQQQGRLQVELADAKRALKEAEKAYRDTGSAADAEALSRATERYESLRTVLRETTEASRDTQNAMRELENQADRLARQDSGSLNTGAAGGSSGGILRALGQAGAWSMLGDVASQLANTLVGSAFGSDAGSLFSSALGGAGSGAAIGTMIAPGIGTAVGAALGGLVGLIGGGTQIYEQQDDAFKAYYQELYEKGEQAAEESLTNGSSTASQRELDRIAFNRLLGEGTGSQYLSDLRVMAASTPMEYSDLTGMSRALATGFGDSPERMLELMEAIGDAGSAVGVTAQDMTMMAQAMSRMQGSGKASLEYLNILQERGVNVIGMLADAYGKTQSEIYDMISKGKIKGGDAVNIIQAGMESMYGGAMETMAQTFEGLTSTLEDTMTEIDAARGNGYNETRKYGIQAEQKAYDGALGDAVAELNRISGNNAAYMENLSEQYTREALSAVLLGEDTSRGLFTDDQVQALQDMRGEFVQASADYENGSYEAGITMDNLRQQAEALGTAAYESSDAYLMVHESELDLIDSIRELAASFDGWRAEYDLQQAFTKGLAGAVLSAFGSDGEENKIRKINAHRYATGLGRVPYNDFPALLHEGERVLTATEARTYNKNGGSGGFVISGNTFVVRQESDIDAIATNLLTKLRQASLAGAYG
ncbi:tape measure protein [Flavonifractor sp. AGMB03687]|uniref:tape measure protein n=1 Tax=Flavonifractor sp. AGMB03687 TaxID=2785133 RepID=UPI001ADF2897|nr:tape measure protein [Flavonifractor sp. AGMB03687]